MILDWFGRTAKKLKKLRDRWGKPAARQLDLEFARTYFELSEENYFKDSYLLDDDTWSDLDLDEVFKLVDRTISPIGSQCLYNLLRKPLLKNELLDERERLIDAFGNNEYLRQKIQRALLALENDDTKYLPYLLWTPLPKKPVYAKMLPAISLISSVILVLALLGFVHFLVLVPIFFFNISLRAYLKRKIELYIYSFKYLSPLIGTADRLLSVKFDELKPAQKTLRENLKKTRALAKCLFFLRFNDNLGFTEYLNSFFLLDISALYSAIDKIKRNKKELRAIYATVGYLDSLLSAASFRRQYTFCRPSFSKSNDFAVANIRNPLLEEPVPNSFEFDPRSTLITGSNMAGKTTFLKTMGLNAVIAQTLNMSFAENYNAPFVKVLSSITRSDDLMHGKSYYFAEVESIRRLIEASQSPNTHLFILDEIFRGTNSVERLAISVEVLKYLDNDKDYILVATHDLQLSEMLRSEYANYHFQEEMCDTGLTFDYKLRVGPSVTTNAIALLEYVGYPKEIVENAFNHAGDGSIRRSARSVD